ncbi:hypothetical protein E8E14_003239 [Neopestalotiopsis sp. 37M]|nr:hypothetical protein E8E14_003239 [Neopestalotiopsis sp. 37M]
MGGANFAWINSSHDELQYDAEKKRAVRVQAMKAAAASRKKTGTWGKQNMRQANVVRYTSETNEGGPQRAQFPEEEDDETPHMRQSQQQRQKQKHQTSTVRARDAWRSKSHVVPVIRFLKSSSSSSLSTNDTSHPLYDGTHAAPPALISRIQQCYYSRPARPLPLGDFERVSADLGLNVLDLDELTAVAAGQAAGSLLARNRASLHTLIVQRRQRSYLFHVPARYGHGSCLDDALRCVAIKARRVLVAGATGGAVVGVGSPEGDSYGFYGKALRGLQAAVDKQSNWTDPDILGAIEILSIYELLESPTQPRNWESHIAGATRLIIARGPSRYETEYEKALLASMVSPIILESLRKQEPCFLDEEPWQKVLWSMVRKDTSYFAPRGEGYMRMWMMGARGPRLMPDMYRMAADPASAVEHEIDDLEARCRALRDDLVQWRCDTAEHEEREEKQREAAGPENGDNNGSGRIRSSSLSSSGSGSSNNGRTDTEYLRKEVIGASLAMLVIVCRLIGAVAPLDRVALEAEAVAYAREMRALLAGAAENKCTSFYLEQKIIAADSVLATTDIWLEGVPRVDQVLLDAQQKAPRIIENWKVLAWTQYLPID